MIITMKMDFNIPTQIHPDAARDLLLKEEFNLCTEVVTLENALHRVSAKDIYAKINVPPFDRSPYDGYAVRGEDTVGVTKESPVRLKIVEEIPAGYFPKMTVTKGRASKIFTGGPVPEGANVCLKFEETNANSEYVEIFREIPPNTDIVYVGEDRKKGDLIISMGEVLNTGSLGELASQGYTEVEVYKKPVVGIFNMGSELMDPLEELEPGKIYNSNFNTLSAFMKNVGFEVKNLGVVKDDPQEVEEKTVAAIKDVDLLFTTGGASVGDYDYALTSMQNLGAEILFWKTAMKPGGSIVLSKLDGKIVFGLSGNPAAALLSLYRVGLPVLYKMCGRKDLLPEMIDVILKKTLNKKSPAFRLLRGKLEFEGGYVYFSENQEQGNGVVSSFVDCDALAEIPMGSPPQEAGTLLKAFRVGSLFGNIGE